ncbi:MAG TPA: metalloregulator ArsR/SmtB family transcription factor [Rhizobacter sp.]
MQPTATDAQYESAADLFALLAAPLRLKVVCQLLEGEKCVSELMEKVGTGQSTLSRHLSMLYRGGVLARRRHGAQVFYRIADPRVRALRRSVCPDGQGRPQRHVVTQNKENA